MVRTVLLFACEGMPDDIVYGAGDMWGRRSEDIESDLGVLLVPFCATVGKT